jgi:hypothetical protein
LVHQEPHHNGEVFLFRYFSYIWSTPKTELLMLRLINTLIVGFIIIWGLDNIPNFMTYLIIGAVALFFLKGK